MFLVRETSFKVLLWNDLNLVYFRSLRGTEIAKGTSFDLLILDIASILFLHYDASDLRGAGFERCQFVSELIKLIEL